MGAFTAWLSGALTDADAGAGPTAAAPPVRVDPARTLLVADFEPTPASLLRHLGTVPRVMALPAPPACPVPGVRYHCFRTATNPIRWDAAVDDALHDGIDTVAFLLPPRDVRGQTLLHLRSLGVRRILLLRHGRLYATSPLLLACWRKMAALGGKALETIGLGPGGGMTAERCRAVLAHALPRDGARPPDDRPLRIAHFVTSLNSGGAERQACNAAVQQHHRGHDVRVLVHLALVGADNHYRYLLAPHGVPARCIGERWHDAFPEACQRRSLRPDCFRLLPPELAALVVDLVGELLTDPVDVLHCYVDDCNVVGALAAALAGTPAVVLSFRNGNPAHFPGLFRPWMLPGYEATIGRRGIRLCANSAAGARDYERWLGVPAGSIPVVCNAFEPPPVPGREEALRWRAELGIAADTPVIAGIFRLQPEKRPLYFLECIDRLRRIIPRLRVVMAGVGGLEDQVRQRIEGAGLGEVVTLLGQRRDVPHLLAGSDVLLLTSVWEGTPNVLLEAQYVGCVPVATDAGGSREAMSPGETGLLVGRDDLDGIVAAVAGLLADPERRARMAAAGRAFIAGRFASETLYEANLRLYREALTN
ncbi:MAG: glycosyltransferase [Gemmataceae bacterium]|nr:glycosyltransferase [Gemmataceae bacterium]